MAGTVHDLLADGLSGWRMAGQGGFVLVDGAAESRGGHGLLWYAPAVFGDFDLTVEWRTQGPYDNSGVFLRIPPLADDPAPAIAEGYEVQIDDRGVAPDGSLDSPLHLTGALYTLAPALARAFRPMGEWNLFEIAARGPAIAVRLNGVPVSRLDHGDRRTAGHVAIQAHHEGSRVQFRTLRLVPC